MAPPQKRKTGVYGMKDLSRLSQKKQKTGVSGKSNLTKPTQNTRKTGIYGMSDLSKESEEERAKERTGRRRLQDLMSTELPEDDGLMDDLTQDHTLGVSEDEEGSDEEDDGYCGSQSEAKESESSDESSVDEEVLKQQVMGQIRINEEKTLREHEERVERVEADNQFTAKMDDEALRSYVADEPQGGNFDLVPIGEDEEVPASDVVDTSAFVEIESGVWLDASTKEVYRQTDLIDPETKKIRKTVRRHRKGPPKGTTVHVSKITAEELSKISEKDLQVGVGGQDS